MRYLKYFHQIQMKYSDNLFLTLLKIWYLYCFITKIGTTVKEIMKKYENSSENFLKFLDLMYTKTNNLIEEINNINTKE